MISGCRFSCARMPGQYKYINKELHTNNYTTWSVTIERHYLSTSGIMELFGHGEGTVCRAVFKMRFFTKHPDGLFPRVSGQIVGGHVPNKQQLVPRMKGTMNVLKARLGNPDIRNTSCMCWTCFLAKHPGLQCPRCRPALRIVLHSRYTQFKGGQQFLLWR